MPASAVTLQQANVTGIKPLIEVKTTGPAPRAYDPVHKRFAIGDSKTIRLYAIDDGRTLFALEGHLANVSALEFSADGRHLISGGEDGSVRLWNLEKRQLLSTSLARSSSQWITITPEGFFNGSPGATELLAIVRGMETWGIDQVWQSLYNPDLVRAAVEGDLTGEVAAAAKVTNLAKIIDSGPAPSVDILSPQPGAAVAADTGAVKIALTDRGKGVGRIEWRVNGITSRVTHGNRSDNPRQEASVELAFEAGENTIEVVAYDAANLIASAPARATLSYQRPPGVAEPKPRLHLLAIGINDYTDQGWLPPGKPDRVGYTPLKLAVKDVTALADDFRSAGTGVCQEVCVTEVLDADATRDNLERIVDKLATEVHPRDTFVLYVAAHGASENGRFYIVPRDFQSGAGALARSAIGQERLQDWFANRLRARRALILLDTCESGALIAGFQRSRIDDAASEAGVGRLHEATGRPVLTAAAIGQAAKEGVKDRNGERHGVFNVALIDALRNADRNGNGNIELSEIVAHVQEVVPRLAAMLGGKAVTRSASTLPSIEPAVPANHGGSQGAVVRDPALRPTAIGPPSSQQARFGSRGEDFSVIRRLP